MIVDNFGICGYRRQWLLLLYCGCRKGCAVSQAPFEMQRKRVQKWSLQFNIYARTTRDKLMCDLKSSRPTTVSFI